MKNRFILLISACALSLCASARVTLPEQIGDNMVLQQQTAANLWGWAKAGSKITVKTSWSPKTFETTTGKNGRWLLAVDTPKGSFDPQSLTISDGEPVEVRNVLIGEVWFGSGQSNMQMPVGGFWNCPIQDANQVIATAGDYRRSIRYATIANRELYTVQDRTPGSWKECTPENVAGFGATAYFFAQNMTQVLNVPVGIINCSWGGSRVEGWLPKEILQQYADIPTTEAEIKKEPQQYMRPMIMYNAMLAPLTDYTIRGFIWYQGESNMGHDKDYTDRFATMIRYWRSLWKQGDLPFYYVEIAPFDYGSDPQGALLREAQFKTQQVVPNTAMVSTNDLVEPYEINQIHPKNKQTVGRRLSYLALQQVYGIKGIQSHGPEYKSSEVREGKVYISFNYADEGFNRLRDIEGFEICGVDGRYVKAHVEVEGNLHQLIVSSAEVPAPIAVRYAFHNFCVGNIGNVRGLPVVPFRTDNK